MALKDTIKQYRVASGMSQADLGKALGISAQAVSKWENGKAEPDTTSIIRMCSLFDTTPDKLYGYDQKVSNGVTSEDFENPLARVQTGEAEVEELIKTMRTQHGSTSWRDPIEIHGSRTPPITIPSGTQYAPSTNEAKILARGMDRMPEADRKRLLKMVDLMFENYKEFFEGNDDNAT